MRQLIKGRALVEDDWFYAGKDEAGDGPTPPRQVLPLGEFIAARTAGADPATTGLRLVPTDVDLTPVAPFVGTLPLAVIEFPSSGDGRGYTQARLLRERHAYRGELRATGGGVRVDQVFFMARCGFDQFELAPGENVAIALAQLDRFSVAYQDSPDGLVHPRRRFGG